MKVLFESDIGKKRAVNQDCGAVFRTDDHSCFVIVCDGMGGMKAGEIASSMAVETVMERVRSGWREDITEESVQNLMLTSITAANINVYDRSVADPACRGMGTTVVACAVLNGHAVVAHAGDSRAYLCSDAMHQITKDHSLVQELVDLGQITKEQAAHHPKKNYITRALGVDESIAIDFDTVRFGPTDRLLLCTDGLTNFVPENDIYGILTDPSADAAKRLVALANENGGGDNITVAVISNDD